MVIALSLISVALFSFALGFAAGHIEEGHRWRQAARSDDLMLSGSSFYRVYELQEGTD